MASLATPPEKFLLYNDFQTKKLAIVVDIPGLDYLTSTQIGRVLRYGDPYVYGDPGLIYGGLVPVGSAAGERQQQTLINLEGASLTIAQRLEPEQGRAAISTLAMSFIDLNKYMTRAITPGEIIPEILGAEVKIWIGYAQTSFPEDYYIVWRGRVAQINPDIGRVSLQFTDPNLGKRQRVFYTAKTQLETYVVPIVTGISGTQFTVSAGNAAKFSPGKRMLFHRASPVTDVDVEVLSIAGVTVTLTASLGFTPTLGDTIDTLGISSTVGTIPVVSNGDFFQKILGPDGVTYDQTVRNFIRIDDELIEYQQTGFEATGFGVNQFVDVVRGARGTTAANHDINSDVDSYIELTGHAIDIALKIQMSGWGGPYLSDYEFEALVVTGDPITPFVNNGIVLENFVDAVRDLGLAVGDFITITGDPTPANNGLCVVEGFDDSNGQPNKVILTDKTFTGSPATPAVLALRSQFDTYPLTCGAKLPGWEVDVAGHIYYKNTYLVSAANSYNFLINGPDSAKTFIETQIMLPLGAYCITRQGKLSMGLTKPPIADERTTRININNVIDPQTIKVQRGLNNRKFFNEMNWEYDYDNEGTPLSKRKSLETDSLNTIGVSSVLPVQAKGAKTTLGFDDIVTKRERFIFTRYADGAVLYDMKVTFGAGSVIEAGDVVILEDEGNLQIPNLATGKRDIGTQLLEVINRSIDFKTGQVSLQLLGGIGALVDDRFATITPSSLVTTGSTTTKVRITESFGEVFPGQEQKKWTDYTGLRIVVHSKNYTTRYAEVTFVGLDPIDNHALIVNPALPFTPLVDDIVELAPYSTSTDPLDQALAKLVHCFLDPSVNITSGVSTTSFNVAPADIAKFNPGQKLLVHNTDYSIFSPEVEILSAVGTLVTVDTSLGFTPTAGQTAELIGFADLGGPYRFI